jgi:glycosyltransferase involved in cell wall biosynthesis
MKKPAILFYTRPIVPPWDEASKNLAFDIASNLSNKFQANLLGTKKDPFNKRIVTRKSNLKIEEIYSSASLNFLGKMKLLKRLYRFKLKVDLIHFLFTPRSLTSLLIRARLKFSKVKTIQTVATLDKKLYQKPKKLKKILSADWIVVQSKNTLNKLKKAGFENVELIYPGIDLKKYKPASKDKKLMKDLKIKVGDFVVLYTGEYTRLKAIDDILEALKILNQSSSNKNIKLILACRIKNKQDAKKKKQVIKWLEKEKLKSQVVFLDTFSEMNKLYNVSDLNIFPAREMAGKFDIPLTLVESMACKKPVIVSKLKNLKELVGKNSYGLVVKLKKPQDLAEKIELLKKDKKLYNKLASNAFDFVKENFDIKKNIKKYETIYENLTFKK